jgi:hypothetical protein
MSEAQITKKIAEIILGVVNTPKYPDLKKILIKEYHIGQRMLKSDKLLSMSGVTFFRLMVGIQQNVSEKEYSKMLEDIKKKTIEFAELDDGSSEEVNKSHKGSPNKRRK